jgi:integrase
MAKGYFRKRGEKWSFTVDIGRDPVTGKRKQKTVSGFRTKKEAEAACAELLSKLNKGIYVEETDCTVDEFMEHFFRVYVRAQLRKRTIENYERVHKNYIHPALGAIKLKDLNVPMIQKMFSDMNEKGLSSSTLKTTYVVLKNALNKAVQWEMLQRNVMDKIPCPKVEKKERVTWTLEQAKQFLDMSRKRNPNYYIAFLLAIFTGMRKSEILGLQWKDIDFDNNLIYIQRSLLYKKGGEYEFDDVKSASSRRTIAIDSFVSAELKKHKIRQNEYKLAFGPEYQDWNLVVTTYKGTPMNQRALSTELYLIQEKLGLPKIRFHDLRHTHATILLQLGANPKVISERLGHSDIGITLDIYSHVIPNMQKEAAEKIAQAMKEA